MCLLLWLVWHQLQHVCLTYMTCCVTKVTSFQFINSNILKSYKTFLTNHTQPILHHIMPLFINALGGRHTDRHTHIPMHEQNDFKKPGTQGLWLHVPGLKISWTFSTAFQIDLSLHNYYIIENKSCRFV